MARLLRPLAAIWGHAAERRFRRGAQAKASLPVVCIGNLTAGGTGKTPLSLLVATRLAARGANPAFLSRGYGGRLRGPHWVAPGYDLAADVGDEPLLLAATAPTLIARDRAAGARAIVATGAAHGAIIMDDGLQNGSLVKDLTIAVVDGRRGIGNGLVIPAGPLRAPLAFQLGLVDAVVVNTPVGPEPSAGAVVTWLKSRFAGPVLEARTMPADDTAWLRDNPFVAFSGIGAPERFFALAGHLGAELRERRTFPDHHAFSEADARELLAAASRHAASLITTEKDWVRLPAEGARGELRRQARVLRIALAFEPRDELALDGLLATLLARRRIAP